MNLNEKDRIRDISAAFAKHDVVIAEVGRWCNLLEADPKKRAANLAKVTEGLALAEEIGSSSGYLICSDMGRLAVNNEQ